MFSQKVKGNSVWLLDDAISITKRLKFNSINHNFTSFLLTLIR